MNATRNTLPAAAREISIKLLNSAVADLFDPYARTTFQEYIDTGGEHVLGLGDHLRVAVQRATTVKDFGTADLLADLLRDRDKQLWIWEAHLGRTDLREPQQSFAP